MQCWIFRFANIVGPKVRSKGRTVIADFILRLQQDPSKLLILGNGRQAKSYLLSEECVNAMLFCVANAREPLNIFNLGCDDWLSVNQIADMVVEALGLHGVRYEYTGGEGGWPGDVPRFRLDVSRINRLGWRAKHNSAQAVALAVQTTLATRMAVRPRSRDSRTGSRTDAGRDPRPADWVPASALITESIPKPMVPVAGVPYLEHQLRELVRQKIHDVVLLTGYLGEQIEDYFGAGTPWGLTLHYSQEPQPLGTGGALRLALDRLAESFLVIYGDSYLPIDYPAVLRALETSSAGGLVVAYDNRFGDTSVKNNIDLDASNYVLRYEKDGEGLAYVEAGVLAFRRSVIQEIPLGKVFSLETQVFPQLIARRALLGYPTRTRFYDIGTPDRLQAFETLLTT